MSNFSMAASHAAGKGKDPDAVFAVLKEARTAIAQLGLDKVINATIGAIYDENENFAYFSTVNEYFHSIDPVELMDYAPIGGLPEFHQAAIAQTFGDSFPQGMHARAVASPGGTGSIRNAFHNYLEPGQKALVPDWFWSNYRNILEEDMRGLATYTMFDGDNNFNVASVKENIRKLLAEQDNLVVVFNSPAHNPTGHCISEGEWVQIIDFAKECAADKQKKITILLDVAYMDYAGDPAETRKFFRLFTALPENLLITIAYSMSKSYLIYGMRSGALIGLSSSEEVAEEFFRVNVASNRGVWSNGTRGAQRLLADVQANPQLKAKIDQERTFYRELMAKRAAIFMAEAKEVGLKTFPYSSGFFITIPVENTEGLADRLKAKNFYALVMKKGIRVAICSVPLKKVPGMAAIIKSCL